VTQVKRETPAYEAGLNVGDEILAVGDYRVPPALDGWKERLKAYPPGTKDSLLVARRERLLRLPVAFAAEPRLVWKLEEDPKASPEQRAHLEAWLRSGALTPAPLPAPPTPPPGEGRQEASFSSYAFPPSPGEGWGELGEGRG